MATFGGESDGVPTHLLLDGDSLFVATDKEGKRVTRYDTRTGRQIWSATSGTGIALSNGQLYFIAGPNVGALDARTGTELWRTKLKRAIGPLRAGEEVVLVAEDSRGSVVALSGDDGRRLWSTMNQAFRPWFRPVNAWFIDGLVWMNAQGMGKTGDIRQDYFVVGLDPITGKEKRRIASGQIWNSGHHQRCYPTKATSRFLIFSRRGADYLNLSNGKVTFNNWVRGACTHGVMPANGLLYAAPHACRCYSEVAVRGLHALASDHTTTADEKIDGPLPGDPLEKGPAYARTPGSIPQ